MLDPIILPRTMWCSDELVLEQGVQLPPLRQYRVMVGRLLEDQGRWWSQNSKAQVSLSIASSPSASNLHNYFVILRSGRWHLPFKEESFRMLIYINFTPGHSKSKADRLFRAQEGRYRHTIFSGHHLSIFWGVWFLRMKIQKVSQLSSEKHTKTT